MVGGCVCKVCALCIVIILFILCMLVTIHKHGMFTRSYTSMLGKQKEKAAETKVWSRKQSLRRKVSVPPRMSAFSSSISKKFLQRQFCVFVCVLQVTSNVLYKSPLSAISDSISKTLQALGTELETKFSLSSSQELLTAHLSAPSGGP